MRNTIIIVDVTVMACVMCLQTVIASHPTEGSFKFAADRTVNHELHAVPVPGPVAIDGDLIEWDTSGGILSCKNVNQLLDQHATWFFMMHDQDALYVAAKVTDRTPLINEFDPRFEQMICHRGDTVFFRFQSGEKYTNFFVYYWSVGKKPAVVLADGEKWHKEERFSDGIAAGCQVVLRKLSDGKGYVMEMRIPWRVITGSEQSHRAGESLPAAVGTYWNGDFRRSVYKFNYFDLSEKDQGPHEQWWYPRVWGTVKLNAKGDLSLPTPPWLVRVPLETLKRGPIAIEYELPHEANVTIVIEDQMGRRVRNLVADERRTSGLNTEYWDGTNDEGNLASPGRYRWRGLFHKELVPTYEFSFGNPGDPPWETAAGKGAWLADHTPPEAVAADEKQIYLASPYAEAGSPVIAIDDTGQKQWSVKAPMYLGKSGTALATDENHVYVALDARGREGFNDLVLYRVDKQTGIHSPFPDGNAYHTIDKYNRRLLPPARSHADWIAARDHNADWNRCSLLGMTCQDGRLYISSYLQNKILVVQCERGEVECEIPIDRPAGLVAVSDSRLLVVSGKQIFSVDTHSGKMQLFISAAKGGLQSPVAMATDRQDNIYVSDWAQEMCVKVFSSQGTFLRRVGKQGGRPWVGSWDPNGMLLPSGIAVDHQGNLWVAEKDLQPKRTSVWSSSGEFLREFIGPAFYKNVGTHINSYDPTQALLTGCELKLDWVTAQWQPVATIWRSTHPMSLFGPAIGQHGCYRTIRLNGREFLVSTTRNVVISERKGDRYQPLVALGHVEAFLHGFQGQAMNRAYGSPRLAVPMFDSHRIQMDQRDKIKNPEVWEYSHDAKTNFYWADRNGDALVQEDEVTFFEAPGTSPHEWDFFFSQPVGNDLTIYPYVRGGNPMIWRLPLQGWTDCGAPLYVPEKAEIIANWMRKQVHGMGNSGAWVFAGGRVLSLEAPMGLYDQKGRLLWSYPNNWPGSGAHHAPGARPGLMIGADYALGEADLGGDIGTIFGVRGGYGEDYLFTLDGLYIANLFRDCRAESQPFPAQAVRGTQLKDVTVAASGEPYGGCMFQHPETDKVYVVIGTEAPCICQIRGLDSIRRLPSRDLEFTRAQYEQAKEMIAQREKEQPRTVFKLARSATSLKIDGDLAEWAGTPAVAQIYLDPNHTARARAAFDDNHLYLAYHVRDRMQLANGGSDWMTLFKTGSAVDFQIGTNPRAQVERAEAVRGDLRVIIAPFQGRNIAVLYRYVVSDSQEPIAFSSPIGTVEVDVVKQIESAQIAVRKGDGHYSLEAKIPLEALAFHPRGGQRLTGDFGVIWSDALGQKNAARCYWTNSAAGIVADLFSEAKIEPNRWGEIEIVE